MRKDVVFDMFKNKVKFVKPLYKRHRHIDKDKILAIKFDSSINLRGDDIYVDRNLNAVSEINTPTINKSFKNKNQGITLPGVCESGFGNVKCLGFKKSNGNVNNKKSLRGDNCSVFEVANKRKYNKMVENEIDHHTDANTLKKRKQLDVNSKQIVLHKFSDTWLRVYPAPIKQGESSCSVAIRCVFCQLGLTAILIIWNIIWVFIIHSFEGPQEVKVTLEFEEEQNQLVIDLATELRQITPLSSKWREAIEKRIEDERQLTMQAVGNGAKSNPGLFWNLSGTFLFSVYVMTALGFGAPVPHTILGRISALVYAILAVPTHIYLMWNVSTCIVVNIEQRTEKMKRKYCAQKKTIREKSDLESIKGNSNRSEKSEVFKKQTLHRYKFFVMLGIFCSDHCILLSMAIYYVFGVVGFGVLRNRTPLEIVMFPLEFTTTGGLENVTGYVRIIYGFYVEGAMCLLACLVSNIRRFSSSPVTCMLENYRLFNSSDCAECYNDEECKIIRIS